MKTWSILSLAALGLTLAIPVAAANDPPQEVPKVKIPEPGVPQIMTLEGRFVRVAYNNEGYVILGYRVANLSVGEKWMLLEVGNRVRVRIGPITAEVTASSAERLELAQGGIAYATFKATGTRLVPL